MIQEQTIRFLNYELRLESMQLIRDDALVEVEPQVYDLIKFFAENTGRLVSRDDLVEAVWNGRIVSDAAISTRINAVRTALGDDGKAQRVLQTIPRRGFRFLPEIKEYLLNVTEN
jgi:DNA-binding winged helix-turn-helix (wHTH) protein